MPAVRFSSRKLRSEILSGEQPEWLKKHPRRDYIEQCVLATPPWVSHKDMMALHAEKLRRTEATGIEHVLDHIIPLKHAYVCGLNVPWNIQIITRRQNAAKSNKWHPDQMDLFLEEPR